jgi:DNA polymerase (family X)
MIDNYFIADQFSLLSKLMDIHGENSFKTKSYAIAAFNIEKLPMQLADTPREKIFGIKGIGDAIGKKIIDILDTGELPQLKAILEKTPAGILEMMSIKGLGPKKIAIIWKEMEIETIGELLYACNENRLVNVKGFGTKTQNSIRETIEFFLGNQGSHLYAQVELYAHQLLATLTTAHPGQRTEIIGDFRRQLPIISKIEIVTTIPIDQLDEVLGKAGLSKQETESEVILYKGPEHVVSQYHIVSKDDFISSLVFSSSSPEFQTEIVKRTEGKSLLGLPDEAAFFATIGLPMIPAFLREDPSILDAPNKINPGSVINDNQITAIIHSHSNWSDGSNTIEEMAKACIDKGYEYLVISDHSKSAFYANGLNEVRLAEQHRYVDELNAKLHPFRIYKSIESDILNDGSLDYAPEVLNQFDIVIASVHSNLKMTEEKAMTRLLNAISNPFTSILGHMTGRLLLSRNGYPVDHKRIIDACAMHDVVIELNAHPRRLDMDWQWISYALSKNVLISIDPDAHSIDGYHDIHYGVLAAQKGMLTAANNLSSFTRQEFEDFLMTQHEKRAEAIAG